MKGLKITVRQGTTLDHESEYFFDHQHQAVVIGCDPDCCDISFPEQYRNAGIGNEHIAFKRSLGRYQIDLNTDSYVLINGEPPFEDQEIDGTATVQLGEDVVLEIEVVDERKQPPKIQNHNPQPGAQVKETKKHLRTLMLILAGVLAVGLYAGWHLLGLEADIQVSDENIARVTARLQDMSATLSKVEEQADGIPRDVIETVSRSVYLALISGDGGGERPLGTAWVIEGGRLATNAHVAKVLDGLSPHEKMIVRSPVAPYRSHVVKKALIHPGYGAFSDMWKDYLPCQKVGNSLSLFRTINPADVAILYLENSEGLSAPLPLATMEELAAIRPGMPVAFVGYPGEALLPGNNRKPVPVAQQDEVIRVTDFFQINQTESPNRLIHHGLPVTGGASGSPMFTAEGKVIGLISSMNVAPARSSARSPNAADVNFGQRIDFLFDLLGPDLENRVAALKRQWAESLKEYLPGVDTAYRMVAAASKEVFGVDEAKSAKTIHSETAVMGTGDKYARGAEKIHLDAPGLYLVRLKSENYIRKLDVSYADKGNVSVYSPKIDFADYAHFAFILAGEPGDVKVSYATAKNEDKPVHQTIELTYWTADLNALVDSFVHYAARKNGNEENLEVVKAIENLPVSKELNGTFYAGFEVEMQKKGHYLFTSVPQGRGGLNAAVIDMHKKVLGGDNSGNGFALVVLDHARSDGQKVNFISVGRNADMLQNMTVYYLPPKE